MGSASRFSGRSSFDASDTAARHEPCPHFAVVLRYVKKQHISTTKLKLVMQLDSKSDCDCKGGLV